MSRPVPHPRGRILARSRAYLAVVTAGGLAIGAGLMTAAAHADQHHTGDNQSPQHRGSNKVHRNHKRGHRRHPATASTPTPPRAVTPSATPSAPDPAPSRSTTPAPSPVRPSQQAHQQSTPKPAGSTHAS